MQNLDNTYSAAKVEMCCFSDGEEDEHLVVFELVVPVAAKVPAPQKCPAVAKMLVRETSVTSTVRSGSLTPLRTNNTALGGAWCTTATLAAKQPLTPAPISLQRRG